MGELGRGGMGVVYHAHDRAVGRDVAIKLLLDAQTSGGALRRFEREGELTAALQHPGIVRVYETGRAEADVPYLVYELIDGARPLDEALAELDVAARVRLVRDAAQALGHAHRHGVVHRDVKPENLLVGGDGAVRVADFGLATAEDAERLTRTGALLGTPTHMAPEQLRDGGGRGPTADVWALGVVLYQALTGELPFTGDSVQAIVGAISVARPRRPRRLDATVPRPLEAVTLRALRKDPRARFADGHALARALDDALAGRAPGGRGTWIAAGATIAAASVALVLGVVAASAAAESDAAAERGASARADGGGPPPAPPATSPEAPPPSSTASAVPREEAPAWVRELPPDERPPLPLPEGLAFTDTPEEVENTKDGSILVWVPPGSFLMGSDRWSPPDGPAHRVTLTRGFYLGKHEVTLAQFRAFRRSQGKGVETQPLMELPEEGPAVGVSWFEARDYCAWAGGRLPTEAEWEYAARGPEGRLWPWGNTPRTGACNSEEDEQARGLAPVGTFPAGASPFGCLDMAGNAREWVRDRYAPYEAGPQTDPRGPEEGKGRVSRGGAYSTSVQGCRTTDRDPYPPASRNGGLGLRLCRGP